MYVAIDLEIPLAADGEAPVDGIHERNGHLEPYTDEPAGSLDG